MTEGQKIQNIADASVDLPAILKSGDKYFDLINFDPRGVNSTTPHVICFLDFAAREAWARSVPVEGLMMSSDTAYATKWSILEVVGESCAKVMEFISDGGENLLEHSNTAPVVGDMIAIIEALGKWREEEALSLLALQLVPHSQPYIHSVLEG
jgi:hypothetical protein